MPTASVPFLPQSASRLDLSTSFDRDHELVAWPGDLAVLMVGVAARQGASATAIAQALLAEGLATRLAAGAEPHAEGLFGPAEGAFNAAVAAALAEWKDP